MNQVGDMLFRYEEVHVFEGIVEVKLRQYAVIKRTPKGCRVSLGYGVYRLVLDSARKRFAHETVEAARESFVARKRRQIRIYEARIQSARDAMRALDRLAPELPSLPFEAAG